MAMHAIMCVTSVQSNLAKGRIAFLLPIAAAPSVWVSGPPSNNVPCTNVSQPSPNGLTIGSAVFAQLICVLNTQTTSGAISLIIDTTWGISVQSRAMGWLSCS